MFAFFFVFTLFSLGLCSDKWMTSSEGITKSIGLQPRVINGYDAVDGEIPYVARLQSELAAPCAASILNEKWAVSEAACCQQHKVEDSTLYYGSATLSGSGVSAKIAQTIIHPNYTGSYYDCICLIELETPITFNDNVQPIALPTENPAPGTLSTVSGWGVRHAVTDDEFPSTLQIVAKSVIQPKDLCDVVGPNRRETQMCTYPAGNAELCRGDMGSPVASVKTEGLPTTLFGFVNALGYCYNGLPISYITLVPYTDWISTIINN